MATTHVCVLFLLFFVFPSVPGLKSTMCEGRTMILECPLNQKLMILDSNYGRTNPIICPGPIRSNNCLSSNTADIVYKTCNNKRNCEISVSNNIFGDSCAGTYKYLEVNYECRISEDAHKRQGSDEVDTETLQSINVDFVDRKMKRIVCEHEVMNIKCEGRKKIHIYHANYGRTNDATCVKGPVRTTDCYSQISLNIISQRCDGRQFCSVLAGNALFGDPCLNTFKYLEVTYECLESDPEEVLHEKVCEDETLNLKCSHGTILHILNANYGRTDSTTCKERGPILTTSCSAPQSANIVKERCEGKKKCSIEAKNYIFGDPCLNTFKYLQVSYVCLDGPVWPEVPDVDPATVDETTQKPESLGIIGCDGSWLALECDENELLHIQSANFGRTDPTLCESGALRTSSCYGEDTVGIVREKCEGKQNCSIHANTETFGDACPNTSKYLEVKFKCHLNKPLVTTWKKMICEHERLSVSCDGETKINVLSANYGRTDDTTCKIGPIQTTECYGEESLNVVKSRCQGEQSCSLEAENKLFGDPCRFTFKYLTVEFECR